MLTSRERERIGETMSTTAPVQEPVGRIEAPLRRRSQWYGLLGIVLGIVMIVGLVALAVLVDDEPAPIEGWMPEYDVDSPSPAFVFTPGPTFWVGQSANLDPDVAWMQSEYEVDSGFVAPLVVQVSVPYVGGDADLDPDVAWMQSEYDVDTPAVSYEPLPTVSFWVGQSGGSDQ